MLVQKQLINSYLHNIHFLHLELNTLPENKKYILGCQCNFCKNYSKDNSEEVIYKLLNQFNNIEYFNKTVPSTETIWNSQLYPIINGNTILYFNHVFNYMLIIINHISLIFN